MSVQRPAYRLGLAVAGGTKWGWDVKLFDPVDPEIYYLLLTPESPRSRGWDSPEQARMAAAAALRELADRVERGEE